MAYQKQNKTKRKICFKINIKKKIAWLQVCFLRDVGVIWCNSLGDSHFQIYVMGNVESVFILCLHVTMWVSHALAGCTHHKQIFVKHCTCNWVLGSKYLRIKYLESLLFCIGKLGSKHV